MGMFTNILTKDNKAIQIYCGDDMCETYKIGDYLEQPLINGVYDGLCSNEAACDKYWVIIKNSKIENVFQQDEVERMFDLDEYENPFLQIREHLIKAYNLQ